MMDKVYPHWKNITFAALGLNVYFVYSATPETFGFSTALVAAIVSGIAAYILWSLPKKKPAPQPQTMFMQAPRQQRPQQNVVRTSYSAQTTDPEVPEGLKEDDLIFEDFK